MDKIEQIQNEINWFSLSSFKSKKYSIISVLNLEFMIRKWHTFQANAHTVQMENRLRQIKSRG